MTIDMSRRGNSDFAGRNCQFGYRTSALEDNECRNMARYECVVPDTNEAFLACAQHLTEGVRMVWNMGTAAVIKQIPGAWRPGRPGRVAGDGR